MRAIVAGLVFGVLAGAPTARAAAESFGNAEVVALHKGGLDGEAIVAKVRTSACNYDTSTPALIALRQAGVPQAVLVAIITRCGGGGEPGEGAAHGAGIFLIGQGRETMLRPSASSSLKLTGNGSVLFPSMAKLIVPQSSAQAVTASARPAFLFQFAPDAREDGDFGEAASQRAQSPSEFSLVHFRVDGGNRQVTVGRVQPYVEISGIDPKNTLPFTVHELGGGRFRVEMAQDLAPGQYGFVLVGERERRRGTLFRIYDFAIASP